MRRSLSALLAWAVLTTAASAATSDRCGAPPRTIRELAIVLTLPLGLGVGGDGAVWVASTMSDRLVRVDRSGSVMSHALPLRSHPVGLAVDGAGAVWFAGSGVGLVGRLSPGVRRAAEFPPPAVLTPDDGIPTAWALSIGGPYVWFTMPSHGLIGRVKLGAQPTRRGSAVTEYRLGAPGQARPEAVAADTDGGAWIADAVGDRLVHVAPDGSQRTVTLPPASGPRGVALGSDGAVWVTLFRSGRLARIGHSGSVGEWMLPAGKAARPWAVVIDPGDRVWVSDTGDNTILCFEPASGRFMVWRVPTPHASVRALAVDGPGDIWFAGAYSGRVGVIEKTSR